MLRGFEIICKEDRPVRVYFREENNEICIDEKFFIEKCEVFIPDSFVEQQAKFVLDSLITKTKSDEHLTNSERKLALSNLEKEDTFQKMIASTRSKLTQVQKIKQGAEDFKKFYSDIVSYLEKKYKTVR